MKAARFSLTAVFICPLLLSAMPSYAKTCANKQPNSALGDAITRAALNEYREFNGHRINAEGHLWKFGSVETETELLLDPENGEAEPSRPGRFAWRRVWQYWLTLDKHVPGEALARKVISLPGLLESAGTEEPVAETRLRTLFSILDAAAIDPDDSLRQAAVRAAISDAPWSAAFISHVMHQAGLDDKQFRYSSAHWEYVKQAFEQHDGYAYRACDPRLTVPRPGDLLCYSRGASSPQDYDAWRAEVRRPRFSAASHCEVVVAVDHAASKIETVGGNVLQSVAMRKLKLNQHGLLSSTHFMDRPLRKTDAGCAQDKSCQQPNLNVQRWSVLLQLR